MHARTMLVSGVHFMRTHGHPLKGNVIDHVPYFTVASATEVLRHSLIYSLTVLRSLGSIIVLSYKKKVL